MSMQQPRSRAGSRRARVTALLVPVVASLLVAGCSDSGGGASAPASVLASASASPSAAAPSPTPSPTPPVVTGPWESKPDLAYAIASQTQKLDLFLPERTGSAVPLVILIHGGGWQLGDKREVEGFVKPLTEQGYAVASINYRLSGEARFPAGVLDAKAAVRWLRAHAGEYGVDPDRFAVWGLSAGGNLAALIGVTGGRVAKGLPDFRGSSLGNASTSSAVQAVVDFYGPSDLLQIDRQAQEGTHCPGVPYPHDSLDSSESLWLGGRLSAVKDRALEASPVAYVKGATDVPPFYLAHGRIDCVVPDQQSTELAKALRKKGVRAELTIVPGFGHADTKFDQEQTRPAIEFLDSILKR